MDINKKLEEYQKEFLERQEFERQLAFQRTNQEIAENNLEEIRKMRKAQIEHYQRQLEYARQIRDFIKIRENRIEMQKVSKEIKSLNYLSDLSDKVIILNSKNQELNKQIQARIEKMALRKAEAITFMQHKIANLKNAIDRIKLAGEKINYKVSAYQLNKASEKYKTLEKRDQNIKVVEANKNKFKSSVNNSNVMQTQEKQKTQMADELKLKNFEITKNNDGSRIYTHKQTKVKIHDTGNQLSLRSKGDLKNDVKAMIEVAKAKGWDLNKIEIRGSEEFKQEVKKQIQEELQKQQEQSKQQQEQSKQQNILLNKMEQIRLMQDQGKKNIEALKQMQQQEREKKEREEKQKKKESNGLSL